MLSSFWTTRARLHVCAGYYRSSFASRSFLFSLPYDFFFSLDGSTSIAWVLSSASVLFPRIPVITAVSAAASALPCIFASCSLAPAARATIYSRLEIVQPRTSQLAAMEIAATFRPITDSTRVRILSWRKTNFESQFVRRAFSSGFITDQSKFGNSLKKKKNKRYVRQVEFTFVIWNPIYWGELLTTGWVGLSVYLLFLSVSREMRFNKAGIS